MNAFLKCSGLSGLLCLAVATGLPIVRAGEPAPHHKPHGDRDGLPLGIPCHVHTLIAGERETHTGKILRVTSEWIALEPHDSTHDALAKPPPSPHKHAGSEPTPDAGEVWIPRRSIVKVTFHRPKEIASRQLQPTPDEIEQCEIDDEFSEPEEPVKVLPRTPQTRSARATPRKAIVPEARLAPVQPQEPEIEQVAGETQPVSFLNRTRNWFLLMGYLVGGPPEIAADKEKASNPSVYYLRDDVQYFPHGPEFKLSRQVEAIEEYKLKNRPAAQK